MKKFYLKDIKLNNNEKFIKRSFFNETIFVYFGFADLGDKDEWAIFDLTIISYKYLIDFVNRLGGIFLKETLLLREYEIVEIKKIINNEYFANNKMYKFLSEEYEKYFDEDWGIAEKEMLDTIEQMKHSKSILKNIKIVSPLNFDKNNFNEKLKLKLLISDIDEDFNLDYYLHIRSISNLKEDLKSNFKFINKCFLVSNFSEKKVQSLLEEIKKECTLNTGLNDIKSILSEYLLDR